VIKVTKYPIHQESLGDVLVLVYRLGDVKAPVVSNTALATFRQLVLCVFEKISVEPMESQKFLDDGIILFKVGDNNRRTYVP
jgi:Dimerisation and cyclophilin-binding domain of Mon2